MRARRPADGRRTFVGLTVRAATPADGAVVQRVAGIDTVIAAVVHATHEERAARPGGRLRRRRPGAALPRPLRRRRHRGRGAGPADPPPQRRGHAAPGPSSRTPARSRARCASRCTSSTRSGRAVTTSWCTASPNVHLRGLLSMLADDDRLLTFVARELDPLREHDEQWQAGLLDAVRALVRHPCSKSDAAASLHMSRPAFYDRLTKIERLLGVDLDDPDVRVSLHVAVVADEMLTARASRPLPRGIEAAPRGVSGELEEADADLALLAAGHPDEDRRGEPGVRLGVGLEHRLRPVVVLVLSELLPRLDPRLDVGVRPPEAAVEDVDDGAVVGLRAGSGRPASCRSAGWSTSRRRTAAPRRSAAGR